MKKVELNIIALSNSESQRGNFSLVLEETNSDRRLPIIIGPFEAQAIAIAIEHMEPSRPMTHDLFKSMLDKAGFKVKEIFIDSIKDDVFHAKIIGTTVDKQLIEVDSRTSDAIALAVRFDCPIFTTEEIMESSAIVLETPAISFSKKRKQDLADYSVRELERMLQKVLQKEDYREAVKIREALKKKGV